jgi:hypothetical protein
MRRFLSRYRYYLLDIVFLAAIFCVARYFFSAQFGLYEDDLTRIPGAVSLDLAGIWDHLVFLMTRYYANRPLHEGFIYVFSWLGWQANGLWGAYWVGYLITVGNLVLFYLLLVKIHSRLLGLLGCLAYALFSADTTQAYLTMSLGGQVSNTLLLLAFHTYLFGRRWVSYLLVYPIILFAYETPFLVFMAAPLLGKPENSKRFWKDLLVHIGIMAAMFLSSFIMRYAQGGQVDFELGYRETAHTALLHVIQGPRAALGSYLLRPYQVLMVFDAGASIVSLMSFIVIALYLYKVNLLGEFRPDQIYHAIRKKKLSELDDPTRLLLQLAGVGAVLLLLAYPMTFTTRLTAISGRTTRGHLAGVTGASLMIAVFAYALLTVLSYFRQRKLATLLLSGWFALLVGFGIMIQQDYVKAWQAQKQFWAELLPLIQDADIGSAILVEPDGLKDVLQIGANTWNLSRVLNQLFIFPDESTSVPRVYRLLPGWQEKIALEQGSFQVNRETVTAPPDNYGIFESEDVIIISTEGGKMKRIDGQLEINGTSFLLKPHADPILPGLPRGVLYQLLLDTVP